MSLRTSVTALVSAGLLLACASPGGTTKAIGWVPRGVPITCPGTAPDPDVPPGQILGIDVRQRRGWTGGKLRACDGERVNALPWADDRPVTIAVVILPDGRPTRPETMSQNVAPELACGIRELLRTCTFEPIRDPDGVPHAVAILVPMRRDAPRPR